MKILKQSMDLKEKAELENAKVIANKNKAITDYNIMMGLLEDPEEGEDDEQEL